MSEQQLQQFFNDQLREVQEHSLDVADFTKNHQLPLARIKKASGAGSVQMHLQADHPGNGFHVFLYSWLQIMKSDEDVRMISAEAPVLFAKVRRPSLDTQAPARIGLLWGSRRNDYCEGRHDLKKETDIITRLDVDDASEMGGIGARLQSTGEERPDR
eukprot:scaffold258549_cov18-Tisochrysis_lutea.AAC.2